MRWRLTLIAAGALAGLLATAAPARSPKPAALITKQEIDAFRDKSDFGLVMSMVRYLIGIEGRK